LLGCERVCAQFMVRTFHLSISSVSQGFSFLCVDGIFVVESFCELLVMVNTTFLHFAIECSISVHGLVLKSALAPQNTMHHHNLVEAISRPNKLRPLVVRYAIRILVLPTDMIWLVVPEPCHGRRECTPVSRPHAVFILIYIMMFSQSAILVADLRAKLSSVYCALSTYTGRHSSIKWNLLSIL
jgi:hypothetical protein